LHRARVNLYRVLHFIVHPEIPVSQLMLPSAPKHNKEGEEEEEEEEGGEEEEGEEEGEEEEGEDEEGEEEEEEEEEGRKKRFGTDPKRVAMIWEKVLADCVEMVKKHYDDVFVEIQQFLKVRMSAELRRAVEYKLGLYLEESSVARLLSSAERHLARVEALIARKRSNPTAVKSLADDIAILEQTYPNNPAIVDFITRATPLANSSTASSTSSRSTSSRPARQRPISASAARQAAQCRAYVERVLAQSQRANAALDAQIKEEREKAISDADSLLALPEFKRYAKKNP